MKEKKKNPNLSRRVFFLLLLLFFLPSLNLVVVDIFAPTTRERDAQIYDGITIHS